ncbi:MAG TPA: SDR family NAD(P)-dependent oxidoreductase [Nocardioidaceae bacterium]|nr:SDR family NAD(P)-dependent oxidoreductase [Nocardioidaceae bacterium]
MEYRGTTAVVTGAGSGIGRALAVELAGRGANLALSDVNAQGLAETASLCKRDGIEVRTYELDVADRGAVLQHAEDVRTHFGAAHLVVNNAGVALGASVEEMTWEDYDWLMGINLGGVVNGTKAFLPLLVESGTPAANTHLVNVSSVFGFIGVPTQSAYNAAKFAVRGFTESLRQEMIIARRPVGIHCVHPGGIKTNIAAAARTSDSLGISDDKRAKDFARIARTTPEKAARTILRGVDKDSARILIGLDAVVIDAIPRLLGARYEGIAARGARIIGPRAGINLEGEK